MDSDDQLSEALDLLDIIDPYKCFERVCELLKSSGDFLSVRRTMLRHLVSVAKVRFTTLEVFDVSYNYKVQFLN